ncbi:MAG: bromoperoxidase [Pseudomonadota bacterium]
MPGFKYTHPVPDREDRQKKAGLIRGDAIRLGFGALPSQGNGEEALYRESFATSFTKGLPHDDLGLVDGPAYRLFVDAINGPASKETTDFDIPLGPKLAQASFRPPGWVEMGRAEINFTCTFADGSFPQVRRWESPRAGHVYDLQGPDAGAVAMAPAPRLASVELAAEMAEVYSMALLRDVSFAEISAGVDKVGPAGASPDGVVKALTRLDWFDLSKDVPTGFPDLAGAPGKPLPSEQNRRTARLDGAGKFSAAVMFRGSTPGAKAGPYISQFLLQGSRNDPRSGQVGFGEQVIDQRVGRAPEGLDYMGDWASWRDVQMGAKVGKAQVRTSDRRFILTPRDLASYVRIDALYQAYLIAALIMQSYLGRGLSYAAGFPEGGEHPTRDGFATFGNPHLLSLVTEVATRGLKAVRRQKFNIHRRSRPERLAALIALSKGGQTGRFGPQVSTDAERAAALLAPTGLLEMIDAHNERMLANPLHPLRGRDIPKWLARNNTLLPMAFIEGSPMHPAYGAGHATVAGACVTVLKAFFQTLDEVGNPITLADAGFEEVLEPSDQGNDLTPAEYAPGALTLNGELDKLAANISIGRNMAGVHYYSDYFDSVRMGERVATGLLLEQMLTYGEPLSICFRSFDGDLVRINGDRGRPAAQLSVEGSTPQDWWRRHML